MLKEKVKVNVLCRSGGLCLSAFCNVVWAPINYFQLGFYVLLIVGKILVALAEHWSGVSGSVYFIVRDFILYMVEFCEGIAYTFYFELLVPRKDAAPMRNCTR